VIWDLGICPEFNLEIPSSSYDHLTETRNLKLKIFKFDNGVDFLISGPESDSGNLNSSVLSFMTCVPNLMSFWIHLTCFSTTFAN